MTEIKIYGIQRSGNNWLMWLLAANFKVNVLGNVKGGWTHGPLEIVKHWGREPDAVLLVVKHPLCWLPSIWRYRGKGALPAYIEKSKEIEKWNERYRAWLDDARKLDKAQFHIVRYEDLVAQTIEHLRRLQEAVPLEKKPGDWRLTDNWMGKYGTPTNKPFDAAYYTERRYMNTHPRRIVRMVNKRVDPEVLERLGYGRKP